MASGSALAQVRHQVVINSPGDATPAALRIVADGLARPVTEVAEAVFRSPTVLVDDLDAETATELDRLLTSLGLESYVACHGEVLQDAALFDVAVHVQDISRMASVSESLASFLGVSTQHAFEVLATPPGVVLGGVGVAAVESLARRLGPGVLVTQAPQDSGPFDLHLAPGVSLPAWLRSRLRNTGQAVRQGWLPLGLTHEDARLLFSSLGREEGMRLVNRALMRWDLVLSAPARPVPQVLEWLEERFGIPPTVATRVLAHPPIALAESCDEAHARRCLKEAQSLGLSLADEPSGFGRAGIELLDATCVDRLNATLGRFGLSRAGQMPARVADDLSDMEARVLAHELASAGARTRFVEVLTSREGLA